MPEGDERRVYKGRIVFRGDNIRDEEGYQACFQEQGASASWMGATKFIDFIAHCPGNKGEDADARSAYTQVSWEEARRLLGRAKLPETYVRLPRSWWPKGQGWENIEDPVVPLRVNLYGHPLAGLILSLIHI